VDPSVSISGNTYSSHRASFARKLLLLLKQLAASFSDQRPMPVYEFHKPAPRIRPQSDRCRETNIPPQNSGNVPEDHAEFEELRELSRDVYAQFATDRGIKQP